VYYCVSCGSLHEHNESNFGANEENISIPKEAQRNKNSVHKGVKN
jgi:hypothetical protein